MHPSRAIRGIRSNLLSQRNIVIAVSGSIAAVEVPKLVRELIRHGAEVRIVASPDALRIITPEALEFASGHPPVTSLTGGVEHVTLLGPGEGQADLLLLAPATANTISKIAHGIDDTAVTSCASVALGGGVPILLAPAMHADMANNPAVRESLERLRGWGVGVVAPASAEGEEKLAAPEEVAAAVLHRLARGPWASRRVIVVGGASREPIDAVRSVTNESSGETAVALATQAYFRGAEVELWAGGMSVPIPAYLPVRRWGSVRELETMIAERSSFIPSPAAVWVPAALADYTLLPSAGKISSREHEQLTLRLDRAPKILPALRSALGPGALLVGFKLEAGLAWPELQRRAGALAEEAGLDWVVANDRATMGSPTARVVLLSRSGDRTEYSGSKAEVAGQLLDAVGRGLAPPARPSKRPSPSVPRARPAGRLSPRVPPRHGPVRGRRRFARRRSG